MSRSSTPKMEFLLTLAAVSPMFLSLSVTLKPNGIEMHPEWVLLFLITLYLLHRTLKGLYQGIQQLMVPEAKVILSEKVDLLPTFVAAVSLFFPPSGFTVKIVLTLALILTVLVKRSHYRGAPLLLLGYRCYRVETRRGDILCLLSRREILASSDLRTGIIPVTEHLFVDVLSLREEWASTLSNLQVSIARFIARYRGYLILLAAILAGFALSALFYPEGAYFMYFVVLFVAVMFVYTGKISLGELLAYSITLFAIYALLLAWWHIELAGAP